MNREPIRDHNLFISTKVRTPEDQLWSFSVELTDGAIFCNPSAQKIRISLPSFSTVYSWPQINGTNNTIVINGTTIQLPAGIYQYGKIRDYVNSQFGSPVMSLNTSTARFTFTLQAGLTIQFPNHSGPTWGFPDNSTSYTGTLIISPYILQENQLQNIYVHLEDISQTNNSVNYDNIGQTQFKPSNILMDIPIKCAPYDVLYFNDTLYADAFAIETSIPILSNFTISLRDRLGNYLYQISDWEASIKIQVFDIIDTDTKTILAYLQSINNGVRINNIMDHLREYHDQRSPVPVPHPTISVMQGHKKIYSE